MYNRNQQIFIIDSDESTCRSLKRLVSSFDISVHSFNTLAEFTKSISDIKNACLLIDITSITDTNLFKNFLAKFKKDFHIIVTTTASNEKSRKIAMDINASMCLQKPIDAQALDDLLKWSFEQ